MLVGVGILVRGFHVAGAGGGEGAAAGADGGGGRRFGEGSAACDILSVNVFTSFALTFHIPCRSSNDRIIIVGF